MTPSGKIYKKGYDKITNDLSLENICSTINKLKAGLAATIEHDHSIMERAKLIYYSN